MAQTPAPPHSRIPSSESRSVAILRADHIGDLVLTTSLMQVLANAGWNVDVVGQPAVSLLKNSPFVSHTAVLREICPDWPRDWKKLAAWLRERSYSATIVPFCRPAQLLRASAASGAKHRLAMGTTFKASLLARLTGHKFHSTDFVRHPRPYYEIVADSAASLVPPAHVPLPSIALTESARFDGKIRLSSVLRGDIRRIGIHPTCAGNTCNLPLATYLDLGRLILDKTGWSILVTGSLEDRNALAPWQTFAVAHPGRVWISAGELGLTELASVLSALDAYIVPSTGPLHVARALGVPTLTPFCPQAPVCAQVWGYQPYAKSTVQPAHPPCDPSKPHGQNCDFRGTLTAADLFHRLHAILPAK